MSLSPPALAGLGDGQIREITKIVSATFCQTQMSTVESSAFRIATSLIQRYFTSLDNLICLLQDAPGDLHFQLLCRLEVHGEFDPPSRRVGDLAWHLSSEDFDGQLSCLPPNVVAAAERDGDDGSHL